MRKVSWTLTFLFCFFLWTLTFCLTSFLLSENQLRSSIKGMSTISALVEKEKAFSISFKLSKAKEHLIYKHSKTRNKFQFLVIGR